MAINIDDVINIFDELFETYKTNLEDYSKKLSIIVNDNDWSFVIKLVAIIDSTITKLILEKSGDTKFISLFESISISRKLDLLFELGLCTSECKTFIKYLLKLRNKLAHNPNELDFNFKNYIEELDKNQKNELLQSINISKDNKHSDNYKKLIFDDTKTAIWINILPLLLVFDFTRETLKKLKEIDEISATTSEELLKKYLPEIFIIANIENNN